MAIVETITNGGSALLSQGSVNQDAHSRKKAIPRRLD